MATESNKATQPANQKAASSVDIKAVVPKTVHSKVGRLFTLPEYGLAVSARSIEEAIAKVKRGSGK